MSDDKKSEGGLFRNLPEWPVEAKELPESRALEPARSRWKWFFGLGFVGVFLGFLTFRGDDAVVFLGRLIGGFVTFGSLGLLLERWQYSLDRRQWREDR